MDHASRPKRATLNHSLSKPRTHRARGNGRSHTPRLHTPTDKALTSTLLPSSLSILKRYRPRNQTTTNHQPSSTNPPHQISRTYRPIPHNAHTSHCTPTTHPSQQLQHITISLSTHGSPPLIHSTQCNTTNHNQIHH